MADNLIQLSKKAYSAYQDGGGLHLIKKTWSFLKAKAYQSLNRKVLFLPNIPPISIQVGRHSLDMGVRDKYILQSGISVRPRSDDTVVEIGTYNGADAAILAKLSSQVIAFEPSPRNYSKAEKNLRKFNNIDLQMMGVWDEKDTLEIRQGNIPGDDGFLEPDSGEMDPDCRTEVPVDTLENFVDKSDIDGIDFLKVEAEGAQPEIIDGLGDLEPRQIAVNGGGDRDGKSVGDIVMDQLQSRGYNLVGVKNGHILFFTSDKVRHKAFAEDDLS